MKPVCYIVGAGEIYGLDFKPESKDLVIAADGGYADLLEKNIRVDMVVGDFDTLGYEPPHENVLKLKPEKDITDTYAALNEGINLGYSCFHLYGCLGGRLEHTIGNLQILAGMAKKGLECWLHGDGTVVTAISDGEIEFKAMEKGIISIFAHGGKAEGVTIQGLKYEVKKQTLDDKFPLGVSNEFIGKDVRVEVKKGILVLVAPKEALQSVNKMPLDLEIKEKLFEMQDLGYKVFHSKLMPTVDSDKVIGVRVPQLRSLAKDLSKRPDGMNYLDMLPHKYYEENNLHAFLIEEIKDYHQCLKRVDEFLPYVDNWATCDSMTPKILKQEPAHFAQVLEGWLKSDQLFRVRYAVKMLMAFYLDENFDERYLKLVADVKSEEYYIRMVVAWYFATALAKKWEETLPFLENKILEPWTHNKTIQKAVESYRIDPEKKKYLKELKVK